MASPDSHLEPREWPHVVVARYAEEPTRRVRSELEPSVHFGRSRQGDRMLREVYDGAPTQVPHVV